MAEAMSHDSAISSNHSDTEDNASTSSDTSFFLVNFIIGDRLEIRHYALVGATFAQVAEALTDPLSASLLVDVKSILIHREDAGHESAALFFALS